MGGGGSDGCCGGGGSMAAAVFPSPDMLIAADIWDGSLLLDVMDPLILPVGGGTAHK